MNAMKRSGTIVGLFLFFVIPGCGGTAAPSPDGGPGDVLKSDAGADAGSLALSEFTLTWPLAPADGVHDFTNMHFVSGVNGPYVASFQFVPVNSRNGFGHPNVGWAFGMTVNDPAQTTIASRFLNIGLGWESAYFHEWFGEGPANYLEIELYDGTGQYHNYCYALGTSADTFRHSTARDDAGAFVDLEVGPLALREGSTFGCAGTPSFHQAGSPMIRIKYRCPTDAGSSPILLVDELGTPCGQTTIHLSQESNP